MCDRMYDEILKPCKNMTVHPVKCRNGPQSELDIRCYDCILVDMDDADHENSTLNDRLVLSGLADYESLDRFYLTEYRKPAANTRLLNSDDNSDQPEGNDQYLKPEKNDAVSEIHNLDEGDVITYFDYNFTDSEVMEVMQSLVSYGLNTNVTSERTPEICIGKIELFSHLS